LAASSASYPRGEVIHAYLWLAGFALLAALLQAVYLEGWRAPVAVAAAAAFNSVLSRAACLWTHTTAVTLIPTAAWVAGLWLVAATVPGMAEVLVPGNPWAVALVVAGIAGGVWPIARR